MSLKRIFLKKILKFKGVPENQIDLVLDLMEADPELFKEISKKIKQKEKEGKDKMLAAMEVMREYQHRILKIYNLKK